MNNKVKELKQQGCRVDVYHGRVFVEKINTKIKLFMSRNDFEKQSKELKNNFQLDNRGGFTKVTIVTKDGKTSTGKFNVQSGKQFDRRFGLNTALKEAQEKLA